MKSSNLNVVFATVLVMLLSGCAAPKTQIPVDYQPTISGALKLKRIAIGGFEGPSDEASRFSSDVENLLTSIQIKGKPYFKMTPSRETALLLQSRNLSFKDLNRPNVIRSVGSSLHVDAIFLGSIVHSGVTDKPYQELKSKCVQSQVKYNKRGKPIGKVCARWAKYAVSCVQRDARFEFTPKLLDTVTNASMFPDTLKGVASSKACSGSGQQLENGATLLAKARNDVLEQIRVGLAPIESSIAVEIMESDGWLFGGNSGSMHSNTSEQKFSSGVEFAKAGRMERACEIWKELEPVESGYVPLLYNIGLCEELSGNTEIAHDYFARADKLSTKPDNRITAALTRTEDQIQTKKSHVEARPDIFYKTAQNRTMKQDQKRYRYKTPLKAEVKIRDCKTLPEVVQIGDTLIISLDYSVMAPKGVGSVKVWEKMVLKRNGKVLKTLIDEPETKSLGGVISEISINIPDGMPPGKYTIEQKVKTEDSSDVRSTVFTVRS